MESSRDDFIIAIRSAFIKRGNKQRFSLVVLILFSIIFLILGRFNFKAIDYTKIAIKELVYRSSFIVSIPENYLLDSYIRLKQHFVYFEEYQNLIVENKELKSQKNIENFILEENKKLKMIIDDYLQVSDEIFAKIIIDKKSPFLRSIIVNKGSKDRIKKGMAVLDGEYLIGKVVEVNYSTSRVLLVSDLNSKIPVTIEPGSYQCILSGTGKNDGVIQYLKENYEIEEKSLVYTSGSGGLYKAGVPIGEIRYNENDNKRYVNFLSDLSQLKFVKIVSYKKEGS
tara:strand:+ start:134 stop:982 length:849 start_codon:yes stop_codon:yes gene_type:complete